MINFESSKIIINIDMYRGFQLDLTQEDLRNNDLRELEEYYEKGRTLYEGSKTTIKKTLNDFLLSDGSLDGSEMEANWFPQIDADIFISHSHQDEKLALGLAGWLYEHFGLKSFIDSSVWGYSDDLLEQIDDRYCRQKNSRRYNYKKRNRSTSHIHMMLSVALAGMIDNTECLFFLNTPHSQSIDACIKGTTSSPWIYSEIAMSRLMRQKTKEEYRRPLNESFSEGPPIRLPLLMDHLTKINSNDLMEWKEEFFSPCECYEDPLDCLYNLHLPRKK